MSEQEIEQETEQELEQKSEQEIEQEEQEIDEEDDEDREITIEKKKIVINPREAIIKSTKKTKDIEVRRKVVKLRSAGKSWQEVAKKSGVSVPTAENIYEEEMALGVITRKKNSAHFSKYVEAMEQRYGEIVETVDRLHSMAKKGIDEYETDDMSDMRNYVKFMKSAPVIIQITREILNQINFLKEEQEKIKIAQQNIIYSPTQINQHLTTTLKYLQKNRYIKVLKKPPF